MRERYAWRSLMIATILAFVGVSVILQIIRIQTGPEAVVFRQQGDLYLWVPKTFYPERGSIYDRTGHLLAGNQTVYEVGVQLSDIVDKPAIATTVATVLGGNFDALLTQIENPVVELAHEREQAMGFGVEIGHERADGRVEIVDGAGGERRFHGGLLGELLVL